MAYPQHFGLVAVVGPGVAAAFLILTYLVVLVRRLSRRQVETKASSYVFIVAEEEIVLALIGSLASFLVGLTYQDHNTSCRVASLLLHFFLLATSYWIFVQGYEGIRAIQGKEGSFLRASVHRLLSVLLPVAVVLIVYFIPNDDVYRGVEFCWLRATNTIVYAVFIPLGISVLANCIFFLSVYWSILVLGEEVSIPKPVLLLFQFLLLIAALIFLVLITDDDPHKDLFMQYVFAICIAVYSALAFVLHVFVQQDYYSESPVLAKGDQPLMGAYTLETMNTNFSPRTLPDFQEPEEVLPSPSETLFYHADHLTSPADHHILTQQNVLRSLSSMPSLQPEKDSDPSTSSRGSSFSEDGLPKHDVPPSKLRSLSEFSVESDSYRLYKESLKSEEPSNSKVVPTNEPALPKASDSVTPQNKKAGSVPLPNIVDASPGPTRSALNTADRSLPLGDIGSDRDSAVRDMSSLSVPPSVTSSTVVSELPSPNTSKQPSPVMMRKKNKQKRSSNSEALSVYSLRNSMALGLALEQPFDAVDMIRHRKRRRDKISREMRLIDPNLGVDPQLASLSHHIARNYSTRARPQTMYDLG